jgi:hypothetical protein
MSAKGFDLCLFIVILALSYISRSFLLKHYLVACHYAMILNRCGFTEWIALLTLFVWHESHCWLEPGGKCFLMALYTTRQAKYCYSQPTTESATCAPHARFVSCRVSTCWRAHLPSELLYWWWSQPVYGDDINDRVNLSEFIFLKYSISIDIHIYIYINDHSSIWIHVYTSYFYEYIWKIEPVWSWDSWSQSSKVPCCRRRGRHLLMK